jgi:hypothetical protein
MSRIGTWFISLYAWLLVIDWHLKDGGTQETFKKAMGW